MMFKASAER